MAAERTKSIAIALTKIGDGAILVDWYTTDDPACVLRVEYLWLYCWDIFSYAMFWTFPQISSKLAKIEEGLGPSAAVFLFHGCVWSIKHVCSRRRRSNAAILCQSNACCPIGLTIYVVGYGVGPILFALLGEIHLLDVIVSTYLHSFFLSYHRSPPPLSKTMLGS